MIRYKNCFALGACLCVCIVASRAACDEPRRVALVEARHRAEPVRAYAAPAAPVSRSPTFVLGLKLPSFLAVGSWSPPATSTRAISHGPRPTECRDHCAAGPVTDRTRAAASAILAGVGALGVATGVVLTVAGSRQPERASLTPLFRVKLSGQRAIASADWRF